MPPTQEFEEGLIVVDSEGLLQLFNPAAERLFGYRADEVLGRNVATLVPGTKWVAAELEKIVGTGREVTGRRKDGTSLPLHLSVSSMAVGGRHAFTGILHDLSKRMEIETALRKSEERLRSIVDSAVDGIIVVDERGRIQAFNRSAERLFGYRQGEVAGRNVSMLMPSPDRDLHDGYMQRYLTTGEQRIIGIGREVLGLRKNGTTFPLHVSVGEMKTAEGRSFTGILHDLSDRVVLEQRLSEQKALVKLGEMAAVVAHEVKNPIAGIRGALQVITSRMPGDQRDRAVLLDIITRLDALNRIVQDMLMFARPRALRHEPISLDALVRDTAAMLEQDPNMSEIQVGVSGSASTSGDREMLQVVFQNILMNAAQAMEGKGRIEAAVVECDGWTRVAIIDRGPGILPEVQEKVFDAFFTTKHRGTGLGLPIARRIVEAHGGSIHIEVLPSGGTVFTVALPLVR